MARHQRNDTRLSMLRGIALSLLWPSSHLPAPSLTLSLFPNIHPSLSLSAPLSDFLRLTNACLLRGNRSVRVRARTCTARVRAVARTRLLTPAWPASCIDVHSRAHSPPARSPWTRLMHAGAHTQARLLGVDVVRVELVEAGLHQPDDVVPRPCEMHYIFVSA